MLHVLLAVFLSHGLYNPMGKKSTPHLEIFHVELVALTCSSNGVHHILNSSQSGQHKGQLFLIVGLLLCQLKLQLTRPLLGQLLSLHMESIREQSVCG